MAKGPTLERARVIRSHTITLFFAFAFQRADQRNSSTFRSAREAEACEPRLPVPSLYQISFSPS
jgi:hypothetical protein